jgi:predicted membrane-bound mannosyltransferase
MPDELNKVQKIGNPADVDAGGARGLRIVWFGLAFGLAAAGLLLVLLWGLPFETARALADRLARDGSLEMFSQALHARYRYLQAPGAALLAASAGAFLWRIAAVRRLRRFILQLRGDSRILLGRVSGLLIERESLWPLLFVTGLSVVLRIVLISKPMAHDESYTVTEFAVRSLWVVLSDYHLPNNHIFHTLLVWIVAHTLGILPWMVRLPALIAGVLLVPAGYLAGRALFNRPAALLGAAFLCASPVLVAYSNNARGYTMVCLFTLLIVGLGAFLRLNPSRWLHGRSDRLVEDRNANRAEWPSVCRVVLFRSARRRRGLAR